MSILVHVPILLIRILMDCSRYEAVGLLERFYGNKVKWGAILDCKIILLNYDENSIYYRMICEKYNKEFSIKAGCLCPVCGQKV